MLAAGALAWTVIAAEMPWLVADGAIFQHDAASCAADAKAADLDFMLKDIEDQDVSLANYKGQVILLDFWATWCAPCKIEIPWFNEFQEKYGEQGFQVIGVSVDDTVDRLRPYAAQMKMNYVILQGLNRDDILDAYGPMIGLPVTTLISREGQICSTHVGLVSKESLEEQIKALL
jgi:thiol-disulfide isomerase/thioredoxin